MTWQAEKAMVEGALDTLLPTLARPYLVVPLAVHLTGLTGLSEARIRKALGWIARDHPNATQDGGKVSLYGRTVDLWRWHPLPQREAGRPAATVVDTQDW